MNRRVLNGHTIARQRHCLAAKNTNFLGQKPKMETSVTASSILCVQYILSKRTPLRNRGAMYILDKIYWIRILDCFSRVESKSRLAGNNMVCAHCMSEKSCPMSMVFLLFKFDKTFWTDRMYQRPSTKLLSIVRHWPILLKL